MRVGLIRDTWQSSLSQTREWRQTLLAKLPKLDVFFNIIILKLTPTSVLFEWHIQADFGILSAPLIC